MLALVVGVGAGLVAGVVTRWALSVLHEPTAETTVTVAAPFAVYLLAEEVHGSGVLAVLSLGLFLRSYGHPSQSSGGWLLGRAVWGYGDYLITSLVFVLIGFELTAVLKDSRPSASLVGLTAAVVVALVVLRMVWVFPAGALARLRSSGSLEAAPFGARESLLTGWAGMRGVVTVATALALPLTTLGGDPFPHRNEIIVVGLATVLVTLVVQGLTLAPLVRALGVGTSAQVGEEVAELRKRAATAALESVQSSADDPGLPHVARRAALLQYEGYLAAQEAIDEARAHAGGAPEDEAATAVEDLLRRASEVERDFVLDARQRGEVTAEAADEVLAEVEGRALRQGG